MNNIRKKITISGKTFLFLSMLSINVGVYADDTEVFFSRNVSKPNVLFALDTSNSMDRDITSGNKRIDVLKKSLRVVLNSAPDNVNVGLMAFGHGDGMKNKNSEDKRHHAVSGVAFPITDINAKAREVIKTPSDLHGLPVYPVENQTVRTYLADIADAWDLALGTPIVDTIYEAALYFRGEKIHYGQDLPEKNGAHPSTYDGTVVNKDVQIHGRDRSSAPKYKSPIQSSCQNNYLVLMTDGAPWYTYFKGKGLKTSGDSQNAPFASRKTIPKGGPKGALADAIGACAKPAGVGISGTCGAELTHYLATHDNSPGPSGAFPNGKEGNQYIETFTIGFDTGAGTKTEQYLKSLATYDDGDKFTNDDGYYLASTPEDLAAAFRSILKEVAAPKNTLASPSYSVNVKNGLEHEKDIYIPVFDRKNSSRWSGNLKKFKIVDVDGKRVITGKNDLNATDELGNFTSNALDYWSKSSAAGPDGREVLKGGVANLLEPDERKIYTNLNGTENVTLKDKGNRLDLSNIGNLTAKVLGLSTDELNYRKKIINFMRGWNHGVTGKGAKKRHHMGDMLHSEPLVLTYNKGNGAASTGKEQYIFAGTNEGYLHAFDAKTGKEKFAFIPADLLRTLSEPQFLNAGTQVDHKYGIDGAITGDFIGGSDGVLDSGDRIIIYFGMRRGGTAYYAMDVTDIDDPKLLWKKSALDHPSMGQSWSTPYVATVADSRGEPKEVIIISGGYDEDEDRDVQTFCADENEVCTVPKNKAATVFYGANNTWVLKSNVTGSINCNNATFGDPLVGVVKACKYDLNKNNYDSTSKITADVGNDVFIFDAKNGNKVWSMPKDMRDQITSSIAGGVRPLDTNNNKLIDRIYFGDTGGNVWRLDLTENKKDTNKLIKLASLGGTGSDNRMFYNEPDVALMKLNGRSLYAVSIGSGFRAHPMDQKIDDKFYVLLDESPFTPIDTAGSTPYKTITESVLATLTVAKDGSITQSGSIKDVNKKGWMINLPEKGEKVLGEATAINGSIIFPTLVPEVLESGAGIDQCAAPVTYSRVYAIDILTGTAKWDLNEEGSPVAFSAPLTTEIISSVDKVFNTPEPEAQLLDQNGKPTGKTGCNHTVDLRVGKKSSQVSGYNTCRFESVYWSDPVEVNN